MKTLRYLLSGMSKRFFLFTLLSPISMVVEVLMETCIPYIMARIIDVGIVEKGSLDFVVRTGLFMVLLSVVSLLAGCSGSVFASLSSQGFSDNLRKKLFAKVQGFSLYNIDKFSTASIVTRLTTDVTNAQNVYRMIVQLAWRAPFMLIAGTFMAFKINPNLASVFFVALPIFGAFFGFIAYKVHPLFDIMLKNYDNLNERIQENLIAIREVKAYVRTDYETQKFTETAAAVRFSQFRAESYLNFLMPVMQLVIYTTIIIVMWQGGAEVIAQKMRIGALVSFVTYVTQILMSLMMLCMLLTNIFLTMVSVKRIVEILDEKSTVTNPPNPVTQVDEPSVEFENVFFSYKTKNAPLVLKNINFKIEAGQTAGIIGGTGSSKSSLVSLLVRFYDAASGTVKVGGRDVRDYDLKTLRDNVSIVLQKSVLFKGTILQNLMWGNEKATLAEVIRAAETASADDFIMSFPNHYETVLEQGAVNISGGQRQRLAIARALLKKPKIIVFDDSTSALDTDTEARIRNALKTEAAGATKIIIAQRISSVKDADIIFVMDRGALVASGSHDELLEKSEIYREMVLSQSHEGDADLL